MANVVTIRFRNWTICSFTLFGLFLACDQAKNTDRSSILLKATFANRDNVSGKIAVQQGAGEQYGVIHSAKTTGEVNEQGVTLMGAGGAKVATLTVKWSERVDVARVEIKGQTTVPVQLIFDAQGREIEVNGSPYHPTTFVIWRGQHCCQFSEISRI